MLKETNRQTDRDKQTETEKETQDKQKGKRFIMRAKSDNIENGFLDNRICGMPDGCMARDRQTDMYVEYYS